MAFNGGSQSEAFGLGVSHLTASGRGNDQSITLGDSASMADQGLDATSAKWDAMSPHGVLQQTQVGSEDTSWQGMQRTQGTYQPGSMETMQDRLSSGSDSIE
jgi:hypothetical protein